jgi:hypothetical protein
MTRHAKNKKRKTLWIKLRPFTPQREKLEVKKPMIHTSCYFKMHMPPGNGSTMRCDDRKIRPNDIPAKDPIATDGQKAGVGKTRLRGMEGKRIV